MTLRYIGSLRRLPLSRRCLSTVEAGVERPDQYCADLVRKNDYESFLVSPFYPTELRPAYFALKAFSVGAHRLPDNVHSALAGGLGNGAGQRLESDDWPIADAVLARCYQKFL